MEAQQWAGGRTSKKKYRMLKSQRPDGTVAGSTKMLALRFYQVKTGHCLTRQYLQWMKSRLTPVLVVPVPGADEGLPPQRVFRVEGPTEDPVGRGAEGEWEEEEPVQNPGPPCRREVQPGGTGLPFHHGCGKAGPGRGRGGERGV